MAKDARKANIEPDRVALATCALIAADRQDRSSGNEKPRSVEDVLGNLGFEVKEVHAIVGGNYNTVQTRVQRARNK
jgi:hypothetical protein